MKTFILVQGKVDARTFDGINRNISISNIVRKVYAKTEEEAIGKFVLATHDVHAVQKLGIECYDIDKLKSVE